MSDWKQSLDRYLTSEPPDRFTPWVEAVWDNIDEKVISPDEYSDNEDFFNDGENALAADLYDLPAPAWAAGEIQRYWQTRKQNPALVTWADTEKFIKDKGLAETFEILLVHNETKGTREPHEPIYGGDMSCENMGCIPYSVLRVWDNARFIKGHEAWYNGKAILVGNIRKDKTGIKITDDSPVKTEWSLFDYKLQPFITSKTDNNEQTKND